MPVSTVPVSCRCLAPPSALAGSGRRRLHRGICRVTPPHSCSAEGKWERRGRIVRGRQGQVDQLHLTLPSGTHAAAVPRFTFKGRQPAVQAIEQFALAQARCQVQGLTSVPGRWATRSRGRSPGRLPGRAIWAAASMPQWPLPGMSAAARLQWSLRQDRAAGDCCAERLAQEVGKLARHRHSTS